MNAQETVLVFISGPIVDTKLFGRKPRKHCGNLVGAHLHTKGAREINFGETDKLTDARAQTMRYFLVERSTSAISTLAFSILSSIT